MIYVTICHFLSINSQLIFTPSLRMDQHRPLISTPSSHMVSPPRFYFFNLVPILCTSIIPIPEPYFFPYTVLNTNITFETNLSILSNAITKFIPTNHHARKTSTTPVKFLHVKFTVKFTQATQISGFYLSIKKITMDVQFHQVLSLSYLLLVQEF